MSRPMLSRPAVSRAVLSRAVLSRPVLSRRELSRPLTRLAPLLALAMATGLSSCADGSAAPGSTGATTGTAGATVAGSTGGAGPSTAVQPPAPTPSQSALPTTDIPIDQGIKDPDMGHQIQVIKIVRNLPWPAGYKASAEAYELIAVEMKWTPGTTYTAPIRLQDFAIDTGSQFPNRAVDIVNPALQAAGWPLLPGEVPNGQSAQGYAVFKVDPKDAAKMALTYERPKSQVTDSGKVFPSKTFTVPLVG